MGSETKSMLILLWWVLRALGKQENVAKWKNEVNNHPHIVSMDAATHY